MTTTTTPTTPDRLVAQRVLVRDLPDRSRISATLRIERYGSNPHPHFSATCDVFEARGKWTGARRSRQTNLDADAGGADHVSILAAFPGARAFVDLHLADYPSGTPMHAASNAWHFLTADAESYELKQYGPLYVERAGTPLTRAARTLRCSPGEFPHEVTRVVAGERAGTPGVREAFLAFVETLRPRWAAEARAARDLLDLMPDVVDLRGYSMTGDPVERVPLPSWLIGADPETVDV